MARILQENFLNLRVFCVLFGGILVMLPIGTIFSFGYWRPPVFMMRFTLGNMAPYIVSYCRYRGTDPHLTYEMASFIFAVAKLGTGLSMWASGYLERRLGVRLATFIGVIVFNLAMFASAWAVRVSFYFLLFTYGLLYGVGIGLAYGPPLVCVMKWMPQRKGVVNGLLLAGFGAGSLIFNIIQTVFINPDNLPPDFQASEKGAEQLYYTQDAILDRVPFIFILQGIIFSIMQIIGIMLLSDPPALNKRSRRYAIRRKEKRLTEKSSIVMNERPLSGSSEDNNESVIDEGAVGGGYEELPSTSSASEASPEKTGAAAAAPAPISVASTSVASTSAPTSASTSTPAYESLGDQDPRWSGRTLSPSELFKDPFFWQMAVALFMDSVVVLYISALYKVFGQTFIQDDLFLAVVGSCASIFNALGRIFWGHFADVFSFKISFMILSGIMAALTFTFGLSIYGNKVMFFIWVCGIFFTIGGVFSTAPTATSRAFGSDFVGVNYGFVFLIGMGIPTIIAAFTQQILLYFLPWHILFIVVGAFPAAGMIISMFFNISTPNGADI